MSGRLSMKVATSVALVIVLLGSVVGLAVVRGDLRFGPKRSALVLKRSKTLTVPITGLAPGDRVERLMTLENRGRTPPSTPPFRNR